ncbi:DeoR/GlpR transcriptional regulator [Enterococcus gallinarum]|uniref:DeoR/GlpR transcriptional regulator n=1 Tax=Enterococcus gallinarum TaxID=1353 RepID=UPI0032E4F1F4
MGNPSLNHRYRKGFYSLFKTLQQNRLAGFSVDKVILGTTSFDKNYGHSTPNYETAEMKKSLTNISRIKIVLCESSKINQRSFKQFAAPDECDYLITDSHITQEQKAELDGLRVNLLIA